jgi:hypothetical protein
MPTGNHSLNDLIAMKNVTIVDYGLDNMVPIVQREINAHNSVLSSMMTDLASPTTERAGTSGASSAGRMVKVDEFSRTATQKANKFATVAFPLENYQFAIGWTSLFFNTKTVADMALMVQRVQRADILALQVGMKQAIFGSTNYSTVDELKDGAALGVKRFVNADSDVIPVNPITGASFDTSTHTHYDATAALTAANLEATVNDVIEHGHGEGVRIYINRAQETVVRALTGFTAYLDTRIVGANNVNQTNANLDVTRLDNRAIGLFAGAEVWTKPWVPANYIFCFSAGDQGKPLAFRQSEFGTLQGLRLAAELDSHPLHAQYFERQFGFGVKTRTNGAVLYIAGGAYVDPVIT